MSFLQPWMLWALPLVALPIVIHLINQRRYQTVPWGAMQFLLIANRMSKGYAKLRQYLILAARTLAIAALLLAISRPLASGWLGLAGSSNIDTTIILLDRSPSMTQQGRGGTTKLQSGINQLAGALDTLSADRHLLIYDGTEAPIEFSSPQSLRNLPQTRPFSATSDLPGMLESAASYIQANRPSRCDVWICSDLRQADWQPESARWESIRQTFESLPQTVRFHVLAFPDLPSNDVQLRGSAIKRVEQEGETRLLLSMSLLRIDGDAEDQTVPVQVELDGARSEFDVVINGAETNLVDYPLPVDASQQRGWGRISLPADQSPANNEFYFVYDEPVVRRTLIVSEPAARTAPLRIAASIAEEPSLQCEVSTISPEQLIGTSLQHTSLVIWQAPLPRAGEAAGKILDQWTRDGGVLLCLPPTEPDATPFAGLQWTGWQEHDALNVINWVADQDLLASSRSGQPLPLPELQVSRHCQMEGEGRNLATLDGGDPLLVRSISSGHEHVYFLATTAARSDSTIATQGVVLYALLHRGIERGAARLGNAKQLIADLQRELPSDQWQRVHGDAEALSTEFGRHAGIYRRDESSGEGRGDVWAAVNRSEQEDSWSRVSDDRLASLFEGLSFDRVDSQADKPQSLIREIWRLFLMVMLLALLAEALLCLPRRRTTVPHRTWGGGRGGDSSQGGAQRWPGQSSAAGAFAAGNRSTTADSTSRHGVAKERGALS